MAGLGWAVSRTDSLWMHIYPISAHTGSGILLVLMFLFLLYDTG